MKKSLVNGLLGLFLVAGFFAFGPSVSQASAACRQNTDNPHEIESMVDVDTG